MLRLQSQRASSAGLGAQDCPVASHFPDIRRSLDSCFSGARQVQKLGMKNNHTCWQKPQRKGRKVTGRTRPQSQQACMWPGSRGLQQRSSKRPRQLSSRSEQSWKHTEMTLHVKKRARKQTPSAPLQMAGVSVRSAPRPFPQPHPVPKPHFFPSARVWRRDKRKGWASTGGLQSQWPCSYRRGF